MSEVNHDTYVRNFIFVFYFNRHNCPVLVQWRKSTDKLFHMFLLNQSINQSSSRTIEKSSQLKIKHLKTNEQACTHFIPTADRAKLLSLTCQSCAINKTWQGEVLFWRMHTCLVQLDLLKSSGHVQHMTFTARYDRSSRTLSHSLTSLLHYQHCFHKITFSFKEFWGNISHIQQHKKRQ